MPDLLDLIKLCEDEQKTIWRIFGIRLKIWDDRLLSVEDQHLWDAAQFEMPNWALFQRLTLCADDRKAREQAEEEVEKEFVDFFADAEEVQVNNEGQGLQSFSATFNLSKNPARGQ